ncbi:MAG: CoA transferase [Nitrososphaerales archaeon]|nr:CoA transferase [Nitrososphaerales archaeon]
MSTQSEPSAVGFLDGVKVVDVTRLLPGGYCTMLLSDMGAEVVKVEQPGLGDYMRATPPTKGGRSPVHETANRNKLSIGIDLKKQAGKEILRDLIRGADVFVEGFRPGAMGRLGFSFPAVRRLNPRIVYCSISAFGQRSGHSSMPGHDINFQAMAGSLGYSRRPAVPLMQLGDMVSGMFAALAILAALARKKGAVFIDVPIVQSLMSWMVIPASAYTATGRSPSEGDSLVFGSDPYYNLFRTSDGKYIAVAAIEERFWHNLVTALGVPSLEQKRFGNKRERAEVTRKLKKVFASKTRDEWARLLMRKETCATPVLTVAEALDSDWSRSASLLAKVRGNGVVLNSPLKASVPLRSSPFTPAPSLGEHTNRIMHSLGYTSAEVSRLRKARVIS